MVLIIIIIKSQAELAYTVLTTKHIKRYRFIYTLLIIRKQLK